MGMPMKSLPVRYHLEIYESSWLNDPSVAWLSDKPYLALSTGDYFEHRSIEGWYHPPAEGQRFQIVEIKHILWEIEDSHISHKLMVLLGITNNND